MAKKSTKIVGNVEEGKPVVFYAFAPKTWWQNTKEWLGPFLIGLACGSAFVATVLLIYSCSA